MAAALSVYTRTSCNMIYCHFPDNSHKFVPVTNPQFVRYPWSVIMLVLLLDDIPTFFLELLKVSLVTISVL